MENMRSTAGAPAEPGRGGVWRSGGLSIRQKPEYGSARGTQARFAQRMSITIENREAEALLKELKAATGMGSSQLIVKLLPREAQRLRARRVRTADEAEERMAQLHRELAARPVLDARRADDILGYDEHGLPG